MKKILALVLAFAMMFSTITVAFAEGEVSAEAKALAAVGMLAGDGNGVTVEYTAKELNRLSAAAALLKLKGLYNDAIAFTGEDNFADVKDYAWVEGKNLMAYLKANPALGFGGNDKGEFLPAANMNEQSYYKVLLETLGYKQNVGEVVGDFTWEEVFTFAEKVGLKPAKAEKFTVDELAKATVAALKANTKDGKAYIATLVEAGKVDKDLAVAANLMPEVAEVALAAVDTVTAIGNTVVEVVFEEDVDAAALENADYAIEGLEISEVVVAGTDAVRLTTAAMTAGKVYTLTVGDEKVKFAGVAKVTGAPKFDKATGTDEQTVELEFDKVLDFASATNVENYTIANVTVAKAEVDGKVVTLTTEGMAANKTYTVKVANINSVDGGLLKSASRSFVAKTDKTAPKVDKVEVMTNTRLLVTFNENVTEASAEDLANYKINVGDNTLAIEAIEMVEKNQVEITTDSQTSGKKYELVINNIVDRKVLANTMTKEVKKTFYGKAVDKIAPSLKTMTYLSKNLILVEFNESSRLSTETVLDINNYEMNNDITVDSAKMKDADDADCKSVILEVSEMTLSKNYKLTVNNITDEYGNVMKESYKTRTLQTSDLEAARVDKVKAYEKTVVVTFTKELDENSAEDISNYLIDEEVGVPVKAEYKVSSTTGITVTLTTGVELKAGKSYELAISSLVDLAGSIINVKPTFMASATSIDTEKPTVEYIEMLNKNVVAVTFSEPMKVGGDIYVNVGTNRANDQKLTAVDSNDDDTVLYFVNATKTPLTITGAANNQLNVYYTTNANPAVVNIKDASNNLLDISADALADEYKIVEINEEPIEAIVFEGVEQTRVNRFKLIFSGKLGTIVKNDTLSVSGDSTYAVITPTNVDYDKTNSDRTVLYVDYNSNFKPDKTYRLDLTSFAGLLGEAVEGEGVTTDKKQYVDLYAGMEDDLAPYIESVTALTRTKVEIKYNEELKASSMTFEIRDEDDKLFTTVSGSSTANSKKVTLTLGKELVAGKAYTLIAKGQFRDLSSNASEKNEEFSFEGTNVVTSDYATVNVVNANVLTVALYEGTIHHITVTGGQGSYAVSQVVYADADDEFVVSEDLYEGVTYDVDVTDDDGNVISTKFEGLVAKTDELINEDLVIAEAGNVALTFTAKGAASAVVKPAVSDGFTIAVKSSSDTTKYAADGKLVADGTSNVVYTVTHTASGKTADTGTVVVTVDVE